MNDKDGYEETAEEAGADYMKVKNDNELELIKNFISKINNGSINNKNKAGNKFRKLKQKGTNDNLKQYLNKNLERYIFEEEEEKFEESVAEWVKTKPRKQNASSSLPKKVYSEKTADHLKYKEEQEKGQKKISDDYDSNGWSSGSGSVASKAKGDGNVASKVKGTGLKILTNKQMLNRFLILLAQIQAGNNSNKLKNEIRQILYSLYR